MEPVIFTEIPFAGKVWVDARDFCKGGVDFSDWVRNKISLYRLAEGLDFLPVDYDENGVLQHRKGTEYLFSLNVAQLLVSDKTEVPRRAPEERGVFINPCHI